MPKVSRAGNPLDVGWQETVERLRRFVAARVGDADLAADMTQDVLLRSIASGALEHVDNPTAWLYRSARNAVIDHYRTRRVNGGDPATIERWPDPGPTDDLPNTATRELAQCLQPMLDQLGPKTRDALTRVDIEAQTHQRAADALGISVSGMKSRVQRGRQQLKALLEECCSVELDRTGHVTGYQPTDASCACAT
jgi:RNA polymerase sigma-70 factor (ECF subfamily)